MKPLSLIFIAVASIALTGCKLAVISTGAGDVTSVSGIRNCPGPATCEFEVMDATFFDTFTAVPKAGYVFKNWSDGEGFLCAGSTNPSCAVSNTLFAGNSTAEAVIAGGTYFHLMPVYTFEGIDTDGDGIKDHIDTDDDGDGLLDADDPCPLNPILSCGINEVSGILFEDTTWSPGSGIYEVVDTLQVADGVTLTIDAGTQVLGLAGSIQVFGNLDVNGTELDPVVLNEVYILGGSGPGVSPSVDIEHALLSGGSIYPPGGTSENERLSLRNSVIEDSANYIYLIHPGDDVYIEFNEFRGDSRMKFGHAGPSVYVRNNVFSDYYRPVITNYIADSGSTIVEHNSFLEPGVPTLELPAGYSTAAMVATGNYWGTTDESVVEAMIRDRTDDLSVYDFISFSPILTAPHPNTPSP